MHSPTYIFGCPLWIDMQAQSIASPNHLHAVGICENPGRTTAHVTPFSCLSDVPALRPEGGIAQYCVAKFGAFWRQYFRLVV